MTIDTGTKLGRYEIRSQLGAGGMGEVYRARDTELGRDVAVKVLPSSYSADSDRLHRFQQEACAAGALNHPNILSIYDVGKHDGSPYVVSELLEGETLRKRIAGSPLAQRRAIDYALQIAHGLAAAHEKGIIHRDLKPDNIFITNDGRVKILDFGLAKLTQLDGNQAQTEIPTRRVDTDPGVVMGTVGYMSPEQLKGRAVDQRTDIFSFGAILYEMLSGRRAFHGESAAETMSAILREDPAELSDSNKNISPALERLVNHCLEKNSEARFHSARDLAFALEALSGSSPTAAQTVAISEPASRRLTRRELILASVAALGVLAAVALAVALVLSHFRRAPTETHTVRLFINPPEKTTFGSFAISPDGLRLVFAATDASGKSLLWVRSLDSINDPKTKADVWVLPLFGDQKPFPFLQTEANEIRARFSPDGRWIAYISDESGINQVYVQSFPTSGGKWQVSTNGGSTPAWRRDGKELFYVSTDKKVMAVDVKGEGPTFEVGAPKALFDLRVPSFNNAQAQFAVTADGKKFLIANTVGENSSLPITVVMNWTADLKR
jgi:serine/threonine protein kinase